MTTKRAYKLRILLLLLLLLLLWNSNFYLGFHSGHAYIFLIWISCFFVFHFLSLTTVWNRGICSTFFHCELPQDWQEVVQGSSHWWRGSQGQSLGYWQTQRHPGSYISIFPTQSFCSNKFGTSFSYQWIKRD
jgi:hypothetical protein